MAISTTRVGMPLADFIEQHREQPFELINGERRPKSPAVFGHSQAIRILFRLLDAFVQALGSGEVYSETTYILPGQNDANWVSGSRIPDVMVFTGQRLADYIARTPEYRTRPLALVPDLVIEVVSPNDRFSDVDEKVDACLLDGVRLVWVIDPQRHKAIVYAPDAEQPLHLGREDTLDGGAVLPGFTVTLATVFA